MGRALRGEWPLVSFTFLVPVLVGWLSTSIFTQQRPSAGAFVAISALAALASSAHLGKKIRAWRAVLNPASSWLSREVLLFSTFILGGALYLNFAPTSRPVAWLVFAIGLATLTAVDRVYATLPLIDSRRYHSASAILTGLLFVGVFSANPLVVAVLGGAKLVLYARRKIEFRQGGKPFRPMLSVLRMAVGFLGPALIWIFADRAIFPLVVAAVLVGELIDRLEFYTELDVVSPAKQMTLDLNEAITT
jgi:DMSO reductase anchor subunit